jgi:protein-L-isoaspartate(D-aspartate) O-methyltransferase
VITVRAALTEGCPQEAPYDAILVDGGIEIMPEGILSQLKPRSALAVVESSRE